LRENGIIVGGEKWQEKLYQHRGMEEALENSMESPHCAHE
jgi:hypothetical protein